MPFNDKSSSEDIKKEFNTSKNYFKMTLGGLMKQKLITQDKEGTRLLINIINILNNMNMLLFKYMH